jgi:hypothetical protein
VFYGGWGDYQQWADHDFRPRPALARVDVPEQGGPSAIEHPVPPTPTMLPLGPRSVLPAGRKSANRKAAKKLLPLAPPPTPHPNRMPDPLFTPLAEVGPWPELPAPVPLSTEASAPRQLVRPYTRTGGRTHAGYRLELETLLSTPLGRERDVAGLRSDHRAICHTCRMPRSTAEVAARLRLPLGAARVLIADVVTLGLLYVHEPPTNEPTMDLLYRIHAGLRNL